MKEVKVEMTKNDDGTVKANVVTTITKNGQSVTDEQIFEGTEDEVKIQLESLKDIKVKLEEELKEKVIDKNS